MAAPAIRVIGAAKVTAALRAIDGDIKTMTNLHRKVAAAVLPIYQSRIPVKTGRLRESARTGATRTRALIRVGGGSIEYAPVITFGWPAHNIAPNRWDIAATAIAGRVALPLYTSELNSIIARHGAGPVL